MPTNYDPDHDYQYNYDYVPPLAFVDKVPRRDKPPIAWYMKVVGIALRIAKNRLAIPVQTTEESGLAGMGAEDEGTLHLEHLGIEAVDIAHLDIDKLEAEATAATPSDGLASQGFLDMGLVLKLATAVIGLGITDPFGILDTVLKKVRGPVGRPASMNDYRTLFQSLPLPPQADTWETDAAFGELRVAGFNPLVIVGIDAVDASFPVTDAHLAAAGLQGDTLAAAGLEGRLYLADYVEIASLVNGNFPNGPKYVHAPKALFVRPRSSGRLTPVAIMCGQDPKYWPVFGQADGDAWKRAKMVVNCADANHHETISHLGHTHLVVGPFAIATPRRLAEDHPIRRLLSPHLEGTLSINDAAQSLLIAPGQQVDKALGGTIQSSRATAGASVVSFEFEANWVPNRLKARRVMDPALEYPYRDDALQIWAAVRTWVEANVVHAYASDDALRADQDLAAWAHEVAAKDGGRLYTFGEPATPGVITTREWLVDALTMVIFTASAQHAAVNFAQSDIMTFAPGAPVALYRGAPVSPADAANSAEQDMFAPLEIAQLQMEFLTLLGGVHYTTLGAYDRLHFPPTLWPALQAFQARLSLIDAEIDTANMTRLKYTLLKPTGMPQSINI